MRHFIAVLLLACSAWAADISVPGNYATIGEAITRASRGDRIIVDAGFYAEKITINKNLQLIGANAEETIISIGQGDAITISAGLDTTTVIEGFTIIAKGGAGILITAEASATIRNCTISGCQYGLAMTNSASIIRRNVFSENKQGAMSATDDQGSVITNNILQGNASPIVWFQNTSVNSASVTTLFANNLLKGSSAGSSGYYSVILCSGASPTIANNIIVDNTELRGIEIANASTTASPQITSNIITGNGYGIFMQNQQSTPVITYNDVFNNPYADYYQFAKDDIGGISADPLFTNSRKEDYTLQAESPCIDTGRPGAASNDPNGTRNDMGIYGGPFARFWGPAVYSGPVITSIEVSPTRVQQGGTITVRASGTTISE